MPKQKHVRSAGFDFTDFGTPKKFREVLKANKMRFLGAYRRNLNGGSYLIYRWGNKDIQMGTANNPLTGKSNEPRRRPEKQKGYASYIGIHGKREAVAKLVRTIKKKGDYKDYDPRRMQFIGVGGKPRPKRKSPKRRRKK